MSVLLNKASEDRIKKILGLNDLTEVMNIDFSDITEDNDIDHEAVEQYYCNNIRGSVRLRKGLFRNAKEQQEFKNKYAEIDIP